MTGTICACRRPNSWFRASCGSACASGCGLTAGSRRRSIRRSLGRAIEVLKREQVEAVAVCYLHAYRDPRHELATKAAMERELPGVYVSLSSEVLPQIKEYERVSTTVVNAYVGPALSRYLTRLERRLAEAGYGGPTLIIQSHGGVTPIAEVRAPRGRRGAVRPGRRHRR